MPPDDDENDRGRRPPESRHERRRRIARERKRSKLESKLVEALGSPALNGGFDRLVSKVDTMAESQKMMVVKVNDVHEAIYNPDDGLFARIKSVDTEREKDIIELQSWRESVNNDLVLDAQQDKELIQKVEAHELTIAELSQHRHRVVAMVKWLAVALGGGGVSLFFQWLSTLIG
jgi:uncharacterized protein with von Willebrand factor type A (vWA) domain